VQASWKAASGAGSWELTSWKLRQIFDKLGAGFAYQAAAKYLTIFLIYIII